jgi:GT2 family glycosyltransferase
LSDLKNINDVNLDVIVTSNIPESFKINDKHSFDYKYIKNDYPLGYGANHNQAFLHCNSEYFLILNPDISIRSLKITSLLSNFNDNNVGIVAPAIVNSFGHLEDSTRSYPTIINMIRRRLGVDNFTIPTQKSFVDWVAGMFILVRKDVFNELSGFDDNRYFMYFEDVDLCERVNQHGYSIIYDPSQQVIHDARRASKRNIRHLFWHLTSMFRYFANI